MPNNVSVEFLGNPSALFRAADAVEARLLAMRSRILGTASITPASVQSLSSKELTALQSVNTKRLSNERAFTTLYLSQLKVREAAELAVLGRVAAARTAALRSGAVAGAASRGGATAASAGVAGGAAIGIAGPLGAALGIGLGLIVKGSVTAYEDLQKRQKEGLDINAKLKESVKDLLEARGIDKDQLPSVLDNLKNGLADTVLFGKDAALILDIYAAKLGKTANELTNFERRQALMNEALAANARNAGQAGTELEQSYDRLTKRAKELLETLGGYTAPAITNILSTLNEVLGGQPAPSNAAVDDAYVGKWRERQAQILKDHKQMLVDLAAAEQAPTANLYNFSLTRFANRNDLLYGSPEIKEAAKNNAIKAGEEWARAFTNGIRANIGISSLHELRDLAKQVSEMRNVISFSDFKQLSQEIHATITAEVEKATERVNDLTKTWRSTMRNLSAQAHSDNPFVKVFFDADNALKTLKENIKGLPIEMQKAAVDSQRAFNAKQLFGARIDNAMSVLDLREMAERFRDDSAERQAFLRRGLDRSLASSGARFNERGELEFFDGAGRNTQAIADYASRSRRFIDGLGRDDSPTARLDRQLKALDHLNPADTTQRALIDQRILRIAGNMDPNMLRGDLRERVAMSAEREAERVARYQIDNLEIQRQQRDYLKAIAQREADLNKVAREGGINAVNQAVEITIKNESDAGVETKQPTPQMSADYYSGNVRFGGWFGNRD